MDLIALNIEMIAVLCLLAFTIFLFVSEIVRVDLAAIVVMVLLGALSYIPSLSGLADVNHLFDGFASKSSKFNTSWASSWYIKKYLIGLLKLFQVDGLI